MPSTEPFAAGGYRFIPFQFQYSGGVVAEPGFRIERARFGRLLSPKEYDGKKLGPYFARLRVPREEFNAPGGFMIDLFDLPYLADMAAPRSLAHFAKLGARFGLVEGMDKDAARNDILKGFVANNLDITRSFYTHPKILVAALNGPTVGLSAALLGFCDFIYATPHTFLLTPFSSLGLVAEGGASYGLVQRMGITKANRSALIRHALATVDLQKVPRGM